MPLLNKKSNVSIMFYRNGGLRLIQKTKVKAPSGRGRPKLVKQVVRLTADDVAALTSAMIPKKVAQIIAHEKKAKLAQAKKPVIEVKPAVEPETLPTPYVQNTLEQAINTPVLPDENPQEYADRLSQQTTSVSNSAAAETETVAP